MLKFAVIGHPVGHSLSPAIHAANFAALGIDAEYTAVDVPPEGLAAAVRRFAAEGYAGFNVTVPHKQAMMGLVSPMESARLYGAVNTVLIRDGRCYGYNTDVDGFLDDLRAHGFEVEGRRVLVLGAGGAGSAVAQGCREAGASRVVVANRTVRAGMLRLGSPECLDLAAKADLVVNATSLGLRPDDDSPLDMEGRRFSLFNSRQLVYDLAPVRWCTRFVREARDCGAGVLSGHGMLVRQAALAFEIWTSRPADVGAMFRALPQFHIDSGRSL